ncbi:MAG: hypothetical protein NVSMB64_26340 [Candidatus Velthaea sp.]
MGIFLLILQLLPVIVPLVHTLEVAIPGQGMGRARLDTILGSVQAVYDQSPEIQSKYPWGQFAGALTGVVGAVVSAANAHGMFAHAGKPALVPAPPLAFPAPVAV